MKKVVIEIYSFTSFSNFYLFNGKEYLDEKELAKAIYYYLKH